MLELPESKTVSLQAAKTLTGKKITEIFTATHPQKFAFFNGDPDAYAGLLTGGKIKSARGHGMFVDILYDDETNLIIGEGTNMRYYPPNEKLPEKYQLLVCFEDNSCIAFTVAMYGLIWACRGAFENPYYQKSLNSISPLDDAFDASFFDQIFKDVTKDLSAKALLATEQRIPGLGNGVLQDILINAGIHPKRKISKISDVEKTDLFNNLKGTLKKMTDQGGRDTEKDFFGNNGGYKTLLSRNTVNQPCPKCGDLIAKEAYLGGAVYFCPTCQRI